MRFLVVLVAVSLMAGCGTASPGTGSNGRVSGHALAGPSCPVERPGDPNCQPKPVQGSVRFARGEELVTSVRIDSGGSFAVEIPAGTYAVTVDTGNNAFPVCAPVDVEVRANTDASVEISCDTGIRSVAASQSICSLPSPSDRALPATSLDLPRCKSFLPVVT